MEFINDEFGTEYTLETPWKELFTEQQEERHGGQAGGASTIHLLLGDDLPSDDEDDADFIAADEECGETRDMDDSSEDESDGEASSDVCSEEGSGLGGSDDDTDDGDVSDDQDRSEELRRLREGAEVCLQGGEGHGKPSLSLNVPRKRRRTAVDYKALNQAMFGDHESYDGEGGDHEWSPTAATPTKATEF
ncbi:uncharacterized protein LOC142358031 [Convolutriloba macropyga]|uniref:uncharacterized protein LOC142358031 n=1 Tax=Convolutriloba macropyga TaxID=536237 RepID=UPI003F524C11